MIKPRKPMKRTELKRKTPLARGTSQLARSPLRSKSKAGFVAASSGPTKPRKSAVLKRHPGPQSAEEKAGRRLLKKRSGGRCETQVPGVCIGIAVVWSHRKRRSQSSKAEKWCVTNALNSCGPCELYLTAHDTDAKVRANGWTVASTLDPASVPVLRRGRYVRLFPDGSFEPLDLTEIAKWVAA
jgi:hypothetical protein